MRCAAMTLYAQNERILSSIHAHFFRVCKCAFESLFYLSLSLILLIENVAMVTMKADSLITIISYDAGLFNAIMSR